jgi:DHA2 family multidrug resistance protein
VGLRRFRAEQPNPWMIAIAVILPTFMEVLDTSIAAVALPHIAGSLSASTDEATWVLTSYLIANAVILPTSGWFTLKFGRRNFLLACVGIFTIASFACGAATTLSMILVARAIQGAGGGALQPLSQSILLESFPPEKRGQALAVYGLGVVAAPVLGPVVGGWLTDNLSWRWAFYVNVPVGIAAVVLIWILVQDPPYIQNAKVGRLDYIGFGLLALWLASLQIILDKGQEDDWWSSPLIRWLTISLIIGFILFLMREMTAKEPVVRLRIFANRNFAMGCVLIALFGGSVYAVTTALPLFFQTLLGYDATASGFASAPRGLGAVVAMPLVGAIIRRVDNRLLIGAGFAIFGVGSLFLGNVTLDIGQYTMFWWIAATGFSAGFVFVPLTNVAMGTLTPEEGNQGSGLYNLMRNVGGSFGISAINTLTQRRQQVHQSELASDLVPFHHSVNEVVSNLQHLLASHVGLANARRPAFAVIYQLLGSQASLWAYIDSFRYMALVCFCCVPIVFLVRKVAGKAPVGAH